MHIETEGNKTDVRDDLGTNSSHIHISTLATIPAAERWTVELETDTARRKSAVVLEGKPSFLFYSVRDTLICKGTGVRRGEILYLALCGFGLVGA